VLLVEARELAGDLAHELERIMRPGLQAMQCRREHDLGAAVPCVRLDDALVVLDVVERRDLERELAEERWAADRVELPDARDLVLERDDIDRGRARDEVAHRREDDLVLVVVEVVHLEVVEQLERGVA
jgi:hypothetical protein